MTEKIDWDQLAALAQNSLDGDKASYRLFLKALSPYLESRIRKSIPEHYREDALQEVLLAIHKSLKTLDPNKDIKPWINAIAHYKVCDFLRQVYQDSKNDVKNQDELPQDNWNKIELKNLIDNILSPLSKTEKSVLLLLKYEGYSVNEVATKLSLSSSNVKVISFRAIRKIREFISKKEFYE